LTFCNAIAEEWRSGETAPPTQLASCMKLSETQGIYLFFFFSSFLPFFCVRESSEKKRGRKRERERERERAIADARA